MIRIGIAEDQALIRESLSVVLNLQQDFDVIWTAETGIQAVNASKKCPTNIVLMDLRMPECDGVTATRHIKCLSPQTKVIILTIFDHDEWIIDSIKAGATVCFLKDIPPKQLMDAIREVDADTFYPEKWSHEWRKYAPEIQFHAKIGRFSGSVPTSIMIGNEVLTPRELEILKRIGQGLSNADIARALFLSEGTVKNYVSNLYSKIGVKNRSEAFRFIKEKGL
ncbi:response regulator transcription factor [Sporolactobacillus putidus]|uniref:DNA-binding response regulator n=1 Tax=Sporolactobacillus putidus TaxID=492735 RepID=A0A917W497_9BACL|nr:response regulator transcription factor [Sporolactobacillus putidus]GGL61881.1 DNA-binding response regulator [Sporolactobacillus putidus]